MKNFQGRDSSHSGSKKDSENSEQVNRFPVDSLLEGSNENEFKKLQSGKVPVEQTTDSNNNKAFSQGLKSQLSFKRGPTVEDLSFESLGVEGSGRKRLHNENKKPKTKVEANVEGHDLGITNQVKDGNQGLEPLDLKKDRGILEEKKVEQKVSEKNKHSGPMSTAFQRQGITSDVSDGQKSRKLPPVSPLNSVPQKQESYEHNQSFKKDRILEEHMEGCVEENVKKYGEEHVQYDDPDPTVYLNNRGSSYQSQCLKQEQDEPIVQESQEGQKVNKASQQLGFHASSEQSQSYTSDSSDRQSIQESALLSHPNRIHQNEEIYDSDELLQEQSSMGTEKQRQQRKSNSAKIVEQSSISQRNRYLTPEEHKIFTQGFQFDKNFFASFFRRTGPPLFQLIKQKQKPKLAVDLLSEYGLKQASGLNRKTFVSMMTDKRLQNFWKSLIEEKNIMDRLLPKKQRSNLQIKLSKLEFIFQKVFETKRLENFFEYKDELIQAAKQLKAMRDNGQLPKQEVRSVHQNIWNELSEEEQSLAFKAYQRTTFDFRLFIYAFRKIIVNIVKDKIQEPSNLMRTQIPIIEKKRKMSVSDCQFLFSHWQFCQIWPRVFQQDLINKRYLEQSDPSSLRVKEYSAMTVLFEKLYLQGKFTDVYQNKELFLELAEKIVDEKKGEHFQKMPRNFWKNFDSGELQAKRKKKFKEKNEKQSKSQIQGQLSFQRLFRAEKKALIETLMEENPNSNYNIILNSQSFVIHLNQVYKSAFYKLFLLKMTKEEIQNDQELNTIFLQSKYLTQKGYYRILTHPEMQKELRQALKEKKLSKYIREDKKELKYSQRIYYEFQEIFFGIFESLVRKK